MLRGVYEDDKLQKKLLNKVGPIKIDALGVNSIEMTTHPMVDASAGLRNRGVSNVNVGQGVRDIGADGNGSKAILRLTKEIARLEEKVRIGEEEMTLREEGLRIREEEVGVEVGVTN